MSYYERSERIDQDGNKVFSTLEDEKTQDQVAEVMGRRWKCTFMKYAPLSPIDYWIERDGQIAGFAEVKARSHSAGKFADVYLNLRKWLNMTLTEVATGKPTFYIVKFEDSIRYIKTADIEVQGNLTVGGAKKIVKSVNDIEPVVKVPVESMKVVIEP